MNTKNLINRGGFPCGMKILKHLLIPGLLAGYFWAADANAEEMDESLPSADPPDRQTSMKNTTPKTFQEIQETAKRFNFEVKDYFPEKGGPPKVILIGLIHIREKNNLGDIENLLPQLLKKGDYLCPEGLDDKFEEHLKVEQEEHGLRENDSEMINERYHDGLKRSIYFSLMERIAQDASAKLVGADNAAVCHRQVLLRQLVRGGLNPEGQKKAYHLLMEMEQHRSREMGKEISALSFENGEQAYVVAGGFHLGFHPYHHPSLILPILEGKRQGYITLQHALEPGEAK